MALGSRVLGARQALSKQPVLTWVTEVPVALLLAARAVLGLQNHFRGGSWCLKCHLKPSCISNNWHP